MKKAISLFWVFLILFTMPLPAFAKEVNIEEVLAKRVMTADEINSLNDQIAKLTEKYGITITYSKKAGNRALDVIKEIDNAFEQVGATFLGTLKANYAAQGKTFTVAIMPDGDNNVYGNAMLANGMFFSQTATLHCFVPSTEKIAVGVGLEYTDSFTVLHELGHAFEGVLLTKAEGGQIQKDWNALNNGFAYNDIGGDYELTQNVFITGYARTSASEDFAEIFAYAFRDKPVRNTRDSKVAKSTAIYKKYKYLGNLIDTYISDDCVAAKRMDKFLASMDKKAS